MATRHRPHGRTRYCMLAFAALVAVVATKTAASEGARLSGSEAILALSGKDMACKIPSGRLEFEWADATHDGQRIKYVAYFKGRRLEDEFIVLANGNLVNAKDRADRSVEHLEDGRFRLSGDGVPDALCRVR